ncbi:MAG TPA: potassium transporter Kup [Stellaceae bacterium]|jgi:KUP system potassium uptake protein|nr:potassium transporter Kup [Stellaceae bacterium]
MVESTASQAAATPQEVHGHSPLMQNLTIAALGVVYGDIGTSPLYAFKQCFHDASMVTTPRIFGVLSLIVWALTIVVTLKYVVVLLRADNRGEGGIFALTVLALRATAGRRNRWILLAGLVGGSLFYGDGVLTPAISVMSAVEGLEVKAPELQPYVLPLTLALLIALFVAQRRGTGRVGGLFGPVIIVWFTALGLLGLNEIARHPMILWAINPYYGLDLIINDPEAGFILLGAVVLAVTGAEALYADMGHFGRTPIRRAWLRFVFPCLLLNYFGQGALLLANPDAVQNPFYRLAPDWAVYPLVVLAAMATVIASQAVISGAFSLTRQAVQLGYLPRMQVRHTSEQAMGQVYVPAINNILMIAVVATVLGFRSSDALGSAYGIAVTGTMTVDSLLGFTYLLYGARWPLWRLVPVFLVFATVDLSFFGANLLKLAEGGWFPLSMALTACTIMTAWMWGRARLAERRASGALPLPILLENLNPERPMRVPGTAVYMSARIDNVPAALLHNMKHNKILHERNVLMTVKTVDVPRLPEADRLEITHLDKNFHTVTIRYGFLEEPDIPRALALCRVGGFRFNLMDTSFFVGREKVVSNRKRGITAPLKHLFILLTNLALDATEFFRIPVNRIVELGGQVEI